MSGKAPPGVGEAGEEDEEEVGAVIAPVGRELHAARVMPTTSDPTRPPFIAVLYGVPTDSGRVV
jgi:hypothetical protein